METVSKRQESLNHNGDSRAENGMVSRERIKKQIKKLVAVVMAHEKVGYLARFQLSGLQHFQKRARNIGTKCDPLSC